MNTPTRIASLLLLAVAPGRSLGERAIHAGRRLHMDRTLIVDQDAPDPRDTLDAPYIGYVAAIFAMVVMLIA